MFIEKTMKCSGQWAEKRRKQMLMCQHRGGLEHGVRGEQQRGSAVEEQLSLAVASSALTLAK